MIKPTATFDNAEVSEIDLRSVFNSQMVGTVGRDGASASFQAEGNLHSEDGGLSESAIDATKMNEYSFTTQLERISGPPARDVLISCSFLATDRSVTA